MYMGVPLTEVMVPDFCSLGVGHVDVSGLCSQPFEAMLRPVTVTHTATKGHEWTS